MYLDRLDGRINHSFYAHMTERLKPEQVKLMQEMIRHQAADRSHLEKGVCLVEPGDSPKRLLKKQEPRKKRRLLNLLLSNAFAERRSDAFVPASGLLPRSRPLRNGTLLRHV